uniref:Phosphopantetheine adenylyltransferase n=1 Tax=Candidatus Endecteinascidia fromenterensis TaxID=266021 RepID=G8D472_9GAMM|nr:pantetheine-phosphate adenylyltransferase [Candidatus Endoecteinascidia frumentensis]
MKSIAIFPGSFDPITLGHQDIVNRALTIFDCIIIGLAPSIKKRPFLSIKDRISLINKIYIKNSNIKIIKINELIIDFAKKNCVNFLIRGIRNNIDLIYEQELNQINYTLSNNIETIFFLAKPKYQIISSTLIKEILLHKGNIKLFVDQRIILMLKDIIKNNKLI